MTTVDFNVEIQLGEDSPIPDDQDIEIAVKKYLTTSQDFDVIAVIANIEQ